MAAEAKHRHNWPALCRRNSRFERFMQTLDREAAEAKRAARIAGEEAAALSKLEKGEA